MSGGATGDGHLVHGMGTALEVPTWPAIIEPEALAVLSHYPEAGRLVDLSWHSPRPFSAAVLLRTERGEFILKRHHHLVRTPQALAEEQAFMGQLRSAGMPVPEVVMTKDGQGCLADDGWTYEVHYRSTGIDLYRDRPSWTPYLTLGHAHAAGAMLGRLHQAAGRFAAPRREPHPLVASFTILPADDPLAAAEAYVAARPALAGFLADRPWREELERLFALLGEGLAKRLQGQPPLWTHNDWHPSNLLWSNDGSVTTAFDFGLADRTCALHDLAIAIERSAIPWLDLAEGNDGAADVAAALEIVAGYRMAMPIGHGEIDLLIRLLPLVHLEFALSEVHYFAGVVGDPEQAQLAWQGYAIGHADWFLSAAGQDFLKRLAHGTLA